MSLYLIPFKYKDGRISWYLYWYAVIYRNKECIEEIKHSSSCQLTITNCSAAEIFS